MKLSSSENATRSGLADWLWGPWAGQAGGIALATLVLDQANKLWLLLVYDLPERGRVAITPFLDLIFVLNTGVSYSMLDSASYSWQIGLSCFAGVASLALWIWLNRAGSGWAMAASIGLIIGGALGNAIDRLWLGGVADFYSLHAFGLYWYVFNIADVAIVAGVALLLYDSFVASRNDAAKPS